MSKTFILALFAVLCCVLFPNEKILFVGSGFRQSKELMLEAERIISGSLPEQKQLGFARACLRKRASKGVIDKSPDAWRIEWDNASYIIAIPLSSKGSSEDVGGADSIRGYRANRLLIDETKDVARMIIDKILRPTTVVKINPIGDGEERENQIVYSGTIDYESNHFWEIIKTHFEKARSGDRAYEIATFTYLDTFKNVGGVRKNWKPPYRMEIEQIESLRDDGTIPEEVWLSEYRCQPIRTSGTYYPYNLILGSSNHIVCDDPGYEEYLVPKLADPYSPVIIGVDVARVDDWSSIIVISMNQLAEKEWDYKTQTGKASFNHVVNAFQCRNQPYRYFVEKLREMRRKFPNCLGIAIDARGGDAVLDILAFEPNAGESSWYDVEDENRSEKVPGNAEGILHLVKATDAINSDWNSFTKGQLESGALRFPKALLNHQSNEMLTIYRTIDAMMYQFISIRTRISEKTHYLSFFTSDPRRHKKDLYSGCVYGMGLAKSFTQGELQKNEVSALCDFV